MVTRSVLPVPAVDAHGLARAEPGDPELGELGERRLRGFPRGVGIAVALALVLALLVACTTDPGTPTPDTPTTTTRTTVDPTIDAR